MKIQSSDDESLAEEEEEVIRLQKEKAKTFSLEDFGIDDESDRELTLEVFVSFVLNYQIYLSSKKKEKSVGVVFRSSNYKLNELLHEYNFCHHRKYLQKELIQKLQPEMKLQMI